MLRLGRTVSTLKRAVRAVLRPIARLLLRPIIRRIDELAVRVDRHLPIIENVIESQNAELRSRARERVELRADLERMRDDLNRVRREIDALRADSTRASASRARAGRTPSDATGARLGEWQQHDELRLHFGWGAQCAADHVDVDLAKMRRDDLAAELLRLPFGERSAVEIRASLVLECFTAAELHDVVLPYWHSRLRPGGDIVAVSIDGETNLADHRAGRLTFERLAGLSFGDDQTPAMVRRCMLSEAVLGRLLAGSGFESIETVTRWRGEDAANLVEVRARRGQGAQMPAEAASRSGVGA